LSKEQHVWEDALVTLREVAKRSGVSIKTVSRIVNNDAGVNAKTRAEVQSLLKSVNYVPNQAARLMRGGTSSVYGLMTDSVTTTPYSVDIVRGAQAALIEKHQTLLIVSTDGDAAREAELWETFRSHRVAGVIYAAMFHKAHDVGTPNFNQSIILANCFAPLGDRPSIIPDDEQGGYTQAKHLLKLGHRHIGIVTLNADIVATKLRRGGMQRAFAEAGVTYNADLELRGMVGEVGREELVAFEAARALLRHKQRPSAIICGNDQVAMQVYSAAADLGLNIPQDLSVIGFDDLKLISETLRPQLTTVALPYFEIGQKAVELSISAREQGENFAPRILIPCPLVERHSCRALD
jgi:LacI family transcriptional regulator